MNQVSKRCTDEVKPIASIFTEELNKLRDNEWNDTTREVIERLPTFNKQSQLFRARRKQIPPLPKTVADVRLEGKWSETGQPVLLLDDTFHNNRIIVYATPDNLQDFAASEMFFCDGTFYTCPGLDGMEKWRGWHSTLTKHLHRYQDLQGHTERRRYSKDLEESRRNRSPTIQEICYNQDETTDAEGMISKRHHRFNDISSEILHLG